MMQFQQNKNLGQLTVLMSYYLIRSKICLRWVVVVSGVVCCCSESLEDSVCGVEILGNGDCSSKVIMKLPLGVDSSAVWAFWL